MATESIREDDETPSTETARPWDVINFTDKPTRPTVPDVNGQERELTDGEFRSWEESKADTAMRKEAASAQAGTSTIDHAMRVRPRSVVPLDDNKIYGFQLSPSFSEERIYVLAPDEHDDVRGYLRDASDYLANTKQTLERIDLAYKALMQDRTHTPEKRSALLQDATEIAFQKAVVGRGKAIEGLQKKIAHTDQLLNSPLTAQAASPRSTELRAVLRTIKPAEVNASIRAALNAEHRTPQQAELLSATLGAHALTVGITEAEQAMHLRAFNEKSEPVVLRRLDLLKKALTIIEGIHPDTLHSQYQGAMRSKFSTASAISGLASRAAKSLASINGG